MLTQLSVQNIILIDHLNIDFQAGLGVLTGETGAGKSIILDALGFVLGNKGAAKLLRVGTELGSVSAVFLLEQPSTNSIKEFIQERGLANSDNDQEIVSELYIRRTINQSGKSKAYINNQPCSLATLKELGLLLIEIHGQHQQNTLLHPSHHREMLDQFARLSPQLTITKQAYDNWQGAHRALQALYHQQQKAHEEADYIAHVVEELEALGPQPGEEERLADSRQTLMHQEKTIASYQEILELLQHSPNAALASIRDAQRKLIKSSAQDIAMEYFHEALDKAYYEIDEVANRLEEKLQQIAEEEMSLDEVEERLFALRGASRKYRVPTDALAEFLESMQSKRQHIQTLDTQIHQLEQKAKQTRDIYIKQADRLSHGRKEAGQLLQQAVQEELSGLNMAKASFSVTIESLDESKWHANGTEKIEFKASTNPGQPIASLQSIASGGELSRFMLALKVVLSHVNQVPVVIFDEIDTGIGGAVADSVGSRLKQLGKHAQVLVVTHQPQVAAKGDFHLKVSKEQQDSHTITTVMQLSEEQRKEEVARMLAGKSITEEARAAAKQLLCASL